MTPNKAPNPEAWAREDEQCREWADAIVARVLETFGDSSHHGSPSKDWAIRRIVQDMLDDVNVDDYCGCSLCQN